MLTWNVHLDDAFKRGSNREVSIENLFELDKAAATDALFEFDKAFREHEKHLFASEGAFGGEPWAPLSSGYEKYKKRVRPGRKILVFDGDMRKSFVEARHPNHLAMTFKLPEGWRLAVGSTDPISIFHHEGTDHMPSRPPIQMTIPQAEEMTLSVNRSLVPEVLRRLKVMARASRAGEG